MRSVTFLRTRVTESWALERIARFEPGTEGVCEDRATFRLGAGMVGHGEAELDVGWWEGCIFRGRNHKSRSSPRST